MSDEKEVYIDSLLSTINGQRTEITRLHSRNSELTDKLWAASVKEIEFLNKIKELQNATSKNVGIDNLRVVTGDLRIKLAEKENIISGLRYSSHLSLIHYEKLERDYNTLIELNRKLRVIISEVSVT